MYRPGCDRSVSNLGGITCLTPIGVLFSLVFTYAGFIAIAGAAPRFAFGRCAIAVPMSIVHLTTLSVQAGCSVKLDLTCSMLVKSIKVRCASLMHAMLALPKYSAEFGAESPCFVLQVWSGALTWCPRCGPPGGMSSVRRVRSSRNLPRAMRGKPWRPGRRRFMAVRACGSQPS